MLSLTVEYAIMCHIPQLKGSEEAFTYIIDSVVKLLYSH